MSFINQRNTLLQKINNFVQREIRFEDICFELFLYQKTHNKVYREFLTYTNRLDFTPATVEDIPFLPIEVFKNQEVKSGSWKSKHKFLSSGTSGMQRSRHEIYDYSFYLHNTVRCFEEFYDSVKEYCYLALLPSYTENPNSSLIAMMDHFISLSNYPESGYFLYDFEKLKHRVQDCLEKNIPTILFGVSFALLDFADSVCEDFQGLIIMETGGMKGRQKELPRKYLHKILSSAFNVQNIHSEYGMTELLSQSYSKSHGIFQSPGLQKILITEINDPFSPEAEGKSGQLNVIDLANIDSCAFIATQDLGRAYKDGSFEILGRLDISDLRGCNLLLENI